MGYIHDCSDIESETVAINTPATQLHTHPHKYYIRTQCHVCIHTQVHT